MALAYPIQIQLFATYSKKQSTTVELATREFLTIINACNDSLVEMLLCQRSGFDTHTDTLFFNLQNERIAETLAYLNNHLSEPVFKSCEYLNISLYCLLDWIRFRELTDFSQLENLVGFYHQFADKAAVQQTDPRK